MLISNLVVDFDYKEYWNKNPSSFPPSKYQIFFSSSYFFHICLKGYKTLVIIWISTINDTTLVDALLSILTKLCTNLVYDAHTM